MASIMDTVSISEHQVFESIIAAASQCSRTKPPEYAKCLQLFIQNHDIKECEEVNVFFNSSWKHYKRLKKSKLGQVKILEQSSKQTNEFERNCPERTSKEPAKKRRKSFISLGARMQKVRTESLLSHIKEFVEHECPEISVTQLLGYLIHSVNIQSEKKVARVGYDIFSEAVNNTRSFEVDEAIALMHSLTLSREQMRKMKHILAAKGIYFPTSNKLLEGRKKLRPVITPVLSDKGVQVQYKDLVRMTVESVLGVVKKEKEERKDNGENEDEDNLLDDGILEMVFKDGGDGAGQQVVWNSKSMKDSKQNMFQYGITPLKLVKRKNDEVKVLWLNHTPNASRTLRPLFLVRESETAKDLLDLVIPTTDKARTELAAEGVCARYGSCAYNVKIVIHDSMKDLKFKKHISGLGGADCILCISKQNDWTDRAKITEGFPIERTAEDTLKLFEKLVNEDGEIPCTSGDFDTRQGLTQKPLSTSDQSSITITHSYINVTTWFLKVLYRCHIDYKNWIERSGPLGDPIRTSKDRVLDAINQETGLYLDRVNTAGGKGGTSTNGPQGRRFFSEEVIDTVKGLLSGNASKKHLDNILKLHSQLSTILSIVSSTRKVDLKKYKELCNDASYNISDNFPWLKINYTLHGVLHHSVDLITRNDGHGLGSLSEEGLEANNKDIRNYLQFLSRKTSPIDQLTDVMSRLLERSDPAICEITTQCQTRKYCTECGQTDHTIRSHARLFNLPKKWYATLVEDIILD